MTRTSAAIVVGVASTVLASIPAQESPHDPLGFLGHGIVLTRAERTRLAADEVVARTVPARDGQVGVVVATRLRAAPETLVAWTHAIAAFKRNRFVHAIQRFSDPPVLNDLAALTLDDRDVDAVRGCRPGDCALKLTAGEIQALTAASSSGPDWREAVQHAFRRVVLARVVAYRDGGTAALSPLYDDDPPLQPDHALAAVIDQSAYLARVPALRNWVERYPRDTSGVESFFYWSVEHYGSGKPVVSVTHVGILRPPAAADGPAIVVAGKQILATHYTRASLGLTMVVPGRADGAGYLVYLNRSSLDVLGGVLGKLARGTLERRLTRQAPLIVSGLRDRLESGAPPGGGPKVLDALGLSGWLRGPRTTNAVLQLVEEGGLDRKYPGLRLLE